jgi:hypothetical protein
LSIKPQNRTIKEQYAEINDMYNKMSGLEIRIESQEQYSRRTSLRFHNIQVLVDERGRIVHPVDIDKLIPQVCNTKREILSYKDTIWVTFESFLVGVDTVSYSI